MRIDPDICRDPDLLAAEVRRLRAILDERADVTDDPPKPALSGGDSACPVGKSVETRIPPEWLARPYWVDPPEGWRWGFPRLYDPQADGNMTEWMIRHGYPERLARLGLACSFTAQAEGDSTGTNCTARGET